MQIIQTIGILRDSRLSSLLKEVVAEPLYEEVEDYVELGHAALVGEGVQHAKLIFAHWLLRTSSLSSLLSGGGLKDFVSMRGRRVWKAGVSVRASLLSDHELFNSVIMKQIKKSRKHFDDL